MNTFRSRRLYTDILFSHQAYGGLQGPAPFNQAVLQSPGFQPIVSANQQEATFNAYLALLNVSTIEQARQLPYQTLQMANIIQVANSTYGTFSYGPVVDGNFVPALPGQLLAHGQYDKTVRVMVGHNADEGLLFTPWYISSNSIFSAFVATYFNSLKALPQTLDYITNTLYPPVFDGSQAMNYTNQIARAAAAVSEVTFTCNTYYLDKAYANNTYAYFFTVPPALHGFDIPYTYYNGNGSASSAVTAPQVAIALQEYITHFAETGNPNEVGVPFFPMYGMNATVEVLQAPNLMLARDETANHRCDWWQKGLWY